MEKRSKTVRKAFLCEQLMVSNRWLFLSYTFKNVKVKTRVSVATAGAL